MKALAKVQHQIFVCLNRSHLLKVHLCNGRMCIMVLVLVLIVIELYVGPHVPIKGVKLT